MKCSTKKLLIRLNEGQLNNLKGVIGEKIIDYNFKKILGDINLTSELRGYKIFFLPPIILKHNKIISHSQYQKIVRLEGDLFYGLGNVNFDKTGYAFKKNDVKIVFFELKAINKMRGLFSLFSLSQRKLIKKMKRMENKNRFLLFTILIKLNKKGINPYEKFEILIKKIEF